MAYRPHIVLQFGGRLGQTSGETWSNTIRFVETSTDVAEMQALAATWLPELVPAITQVMTAGGYSNAAWLDFIKANAVGADGRQPNTSTNAWFAGDDFTAVNGSLTAGPFQVAMAISFTTQAVRGIGSKGRVYVPTGSIEQGTSFDGQTGLISVAQATAWRDAWATFLQTLDDNPGPDFANLRAAVVSSRGSDPGNWHTINGVRVGRVPDTQRRRRNALQENYTATAVVDYA